MRGAEEGGYAVKEDARPLTPSSPEGPEASDRAREAGARWAAVYEVGKAGERLTYRIAIYDSADGRVVGGDSFSALFGVTTIQLVGGSAEQVVGRIGAYAAARASEPRRVVDYQVVVKCKAEGAAVSIEGEGAPRPDSLGTIEGGELELPYLPFIVGTTLRVSAMGKDGSIMRASALLGPDPVTVELVRERRLPDLLLGLGTTGLPDVRGTVRAYVQPDWDFLFLGAEAGVDASYLRGSIPTQRDGAELGFGGYLFLPPQSRLRVGCAVACGPLLSFAASQGREKAYLDLAVAPIDLFGEYRFEKDLALWLGVESKFSFGLDSGILGREWIDRGIPSVSAGILWGRRG